MHATLEAVRECPFAAPARVDLRLHHEFLRAELRRDRGGLFGGAGDAPRVRGDAEFFKEFAGLVFVDVHRAKDATGSGGAVARNDRNEEIRPRISYAK